MKNKLPPSTAFELRSDCKGKGRKRYQRQIGRCCRRRVRLRSNLVKIRLQGPRNKRENSRKCSILWIQNTAHLRCNNAQENSYSWAKVKDDCQAGNSVLKMFALPPASLVPSPKMQECVCFISSQLFASPNMQECMCFTSSEFVSVSQRPEVPKTAAFIHSETPPGTSHCPY